MMNDKFKGISYKSDIPQGSELDPLSLEPREGKDETSERAINLTNTFTKYNNTVIARALSSCYLLSLG